MTQTLYTVRYKAPLPIGNDSSRFYAANLREATEHAETLCARNRWEFKSVAPVVPDEAARVDPFSVMRNAAAGDMFDALCALERAGVFSSDSAAEYYSASGAAKRQARKALAKARGET